VWRDFQAGVGGYTDSLLMRESERSMSVGDVVELDGDRYVARGIGFSEI
jgi:tartrate dehydratase beta subunit/fumarate hydratase class I family protein